MGGMPKWGAVDLTYRNLGKERCYILDESRNVNLLLIHILVRWSSPGPWEL